MPSWQFFCPPYGAVKHVINFREKTLVSAKEKKKTSEPPAFDLKQLDRWSVCFDSFYPKSAWKSNLILKLAGVLFPMWQ